MKYFEKQVGHLCLISSKELKNTLGIVVSFTFSIVVRICRILIWWTFKSLISFRRGLAWAYFFLWNINWTACFFLVSIFFKFSLGCTSPCNIAISYIWTCINEQYIYVPALPILEGDSWFWTSSPVLPPKLKFSRSVEKMKQTFGEKH